MHPSELSSLIGYHRKRARLSQADLALHAGVGRSVVQDLESGKDRASLKNLRAVLGVLNIQLEPTGPLVEMWKKETPREEEGL